MPHLSWPRSSMSGRVLSPRVVALVGFNFSKSQCRRLGMRGEGAKGGWLVGVMMMTDGKMKLKQNLLKRVN